MSDQENLITTSTVAAPIARVFAVLADPGTHAAIDGTGWVREPVDRAPLTETGQLFRMDMYHASRPVGEYRVVNKVHVIEAPRIIGWLTGQEKDGGKPEFGGWFWRYDLASAGPDETEVTLTYDWSAVPSSIREYLTFPPFGPEHLGNSLRHLAEITTATSKA